jgi:hypothetical protein
VLRANAALQRARKGMPGIDKDKNSKNRIQSKENYTTDRLNESENERKLLLLPSTPGSHENFQCLASLDLTRRAIILSPFALYCQTSDMFYRWRTYGAVENSSNS